MSLAITLFVLVITFVFLWWRLHFNFWQKRKIPNVRGLFSGCFKDLIVFRTNFPIHLSKIYADPQFENEPVVGVYAPHSPALLIRDLDLLKSIFNKDFGYFRTRFGRNDNDGDPIGRRVMFISTYKLWKDMRSKLSSLFTGGSIKRLYPLVRTVGQNVQKYVDQMESGSIIEMKNFTNLYTIDITNTTIFGIESNVLENPDDQLAIETKRVADFNWKRNFDWLIMFLMPQFSKFFRIRVFFRETEEFLKSITHLLITERENTGAKRHDLIDTFVKLKQEAEANGDDMARFMNDLTSQVGLLLFAGYDTSSTTLSNVLFELAKNPDIQKRLRAEIKQTFAEGNGEISFEALSKMEYMGMVLDETLRRYPPLPLLERRHDRADDGTLYSLLPYADYTLPPGMPVYISTLGLHHDPKVCRP